MERSFESEESGERKPYFISVQAGQILEDPEAAAYELEIVAGEEELSKLRELFEELSSMDEAEAFHFGGRPFSPDSDEILNGASDEIIGRIYQFLYEYGTDKTKRHIEAMGIMQH
ncbi:hypothetical protein ACFQZE_09970 [Paenibacillus sp. GCM10027627]|uniref:hypothetical protein n=1 Tax=unclassified Paenibacillus TaxID=185978 RepID=UPI0036382CC9